MILPFIGDVTLLGGIITVILFVVGYFVGSSLKHGLKYALIFGAFIFILVALGYIPTDILKQIVQTLQILQPLYDKFMSVQSILGTISMPMLGMGAGFVWGLLKG